MPSARALIILEPTLGSFAHAGTSPHFMRESTWSVCSANTCWVGRTSPLSRIGGTLLVTRNRMKTRCPSTSSYLPHILAHLPPANPPSSRAQYVRLHIKPTLGKVSLVKLTPQQLQTLYAQKLLISV